MISEKQIKKYVYTELNKIGVQIEGIDDTELVESRILSSLGLVQIIAGLEDMLGTFIITDDISIDELTSVNKIVRIALNVQKN